MDFTDFKAGQDDDNRRLDKIIRIFAVQLPLSQIYKLLRKGLIRVNGNKASADYRVKNGDIIQIASFLLNENKKEEPSLEKNIITSDLIVFENEHLIIINKPYDISVHGDNNSLDNQIRHYLRQKDNQSDSKSLSFTSGPLHRLDRKTSGLLVFSKSLKGARWFSENINNHSIQKKYSAIIQGHLNSVQKWNDYIFSENEDSNNIKSFHTVKCSEKELSKDWKYAQSSIEALAYGKLGHQDITLAEITIKTGRKHQIRCQSAFHGFPLLGDIAYGGEQINKKELKRDFYLMASSLLLPENELGLPGELKLDVNKDFFDIIKYCDIK